MTPRIPLAFSVTIALATALGVGAAWGQVVSPGKLADAHAHLEGSKNCQQCHSKKGRVEPSLCLSCHDVLGARIQQRKGYHASLGTSRCGKCHQDHRGRSFDIVRWPSRTASAFNHRLARYQLRGSHAKAKCRDCHKPAFQVDARVKKFRQDRRKRTYLGLTQRCTSCHEDHHEGRLGDTCAKCHDETSFKGADRFDHDDARFVLRNAHVKVECDDCHRRPGKTPEVLFRGIAFRTCDACHKEPHRGAMADRKGKTQCDACHNDVAWDRLTYRKADHSPQRMPLRGGHAKATCVDCHGSKATRQPSAACTSCHKDVHNNRFGKDCGRCHDVTSWRAQPPRTRVASRSRINASARLGLTRRELARVEFHRKARFPLDGLHVRVKCDKCHPRSQKNFRKRFQRIKHDACSDCHDDPHGGQFDGTRCRDCHTTDGWQLTTYGVTEHTRAKFALDGSHRGVACVGCHPATRPDATRYRFDDRTCEACHDDYHQGQFATHVDATRPQRACADCHNTKAFTDVKFDHAGTRFPLEGAHENTVCGSCHRASAGGDQVTYRGLSPTCESCHKDEHQGQLRKPPTKRLCQDCHGQDKFAIARFDHDNQTDYQLDGEHQRARCEQCHHKVSLRGGRNIVLYRLGQTTCNQCHKSQHTTRADRVRGPSKNRLLGRKADKDANRVTVDTCERCHSTRGWAEFNATPGDLSRFDHSDVGYTLDGAHRATRCAQCHTAQRTLTRQCSGCHTDRHAGRLGPECANCHQTSSWRATDIRDRHRRTRLPLTGAHALADCTSCHPRDRQGQYVAVPVACVNCHFLEYNDPATHPDHALSSFGTECQQCHRPAGWSPAYFAHTTFPLRGAHRVASCSSCHERDPTPRDCASCHQDDLARATSPDHTAAGFPSDCGQCHSETAWRPADFPMHEQSFPIAAGPHSGFDCMDCHTNPADSVDFTCLAPCHTRPDMDDEHGDVPSYIYESRACLMCHPDGRE